MKTNVIKWDEGFALRCLERSTRYLERGTSYMERSTGYLTEDIPGTAPVDIEDIQADTGLYKDTHTDNGIIGDALAIGGPSVFDSQWADFEKALKKALKNK